MKKAAFVIPYFGKFNNYFPLFLKSCSYNSDFDWLIFTDDKRQFDYPDNVHVFYKSFAEIREFFQCKFDFPISLERAYKLCDYKVCYGYVFADFLRDYKAWGYCDTDLLFGELNAYITGRDLEQYDKLGIFGHLTLYRNTDEINRLFMQSINGRLRYKEVFISPYNHSFDEEFKYSINNIFENANKRIRYAEYQANIYTKSSDFRLTAINDDRRTYHHEELKKAFFVWDRGKIKRYVMEYGQLKSYEYMYIHMQMRPMKVNVALDAKRIKIIPNSFDELEVDKVTEDNFDNIRRKHFNLHYFRLRSRNLWIKTKKKLGLQKY